ncbi:MAG: lanthionine synthetase C family protein [Acidobacteriota bacterium]
MNVDGHSQDGYGQDGYSEQSGLSSERWRRLLEGDLAAEAQQAVDRLAGGLAKLPTGYAQGAQWGAAALDAGRLGQALFWAYRARVTDDAEAADRAVECFDAASDELVRLPMQPILYAGFLGTAWVGDYLQEWIFEADDDLASEDDDNGEIDAALLKSLTPTTGLWNCDLLKGLVGCGVYALQRLPRRRAVLCLERIVDHLAARAVEVGPGVSWPPLAEVDPRVTYRLGLAHGTAGVVAFLAAVCRAGVATDRARPLLDQACAWLLSVLAPGGDVSRCPVRVSPEGDVAPPALSWCSGSPGIAAGLLLAARCCEHRGWETAALELARAASASSEDLPDAGFCHGAAGVAHTFHRMYQATGEPTFAAAARTWLQRLLASQQLDMGETGFFTDPLSPHIGVRPGGPELQETGGLMRGAAGIGLVLQAAISDEAPDWDRLMLLSVGRD